MPHVIERLRQDHQKVAQLFDQLLKSDHRASAARATLRTQVVRTLEAHTEFEEQVFYPAIEAAGDQAGEEVEEALDAHYEINELLERLAAMDADDPGFLDLVNEIQVAVAAHVQHEEDDIFPFAQAELDDAAAQEMARQHESMANDHTRQYVGR